VAVRRTQNRFWNCTLSLQVRTSARDQPKSAQGGRTGHRGRYIKWKPGACRSGRILSIELVEFIASTVTIASDPPALGCADASTGAANESCCMSSISSWTSEYEITLFVTSGEKTNVSLPCFSYKNSSANFAAATAGAAPICPLPLRSCP